MTIVYTYGYEHSDSTQKGLKARPYNMDVEDHIVTLPKRGLKTRPYSMDMNKDITKNDLILNSTPENRL